MTDWNPDDPADLGVWKELGWTVWLIVYILLLTHVWLHVYCSCLLNCLAHVTSAPLAHVTSLLNPYATVMSGWVG